MTFSDAQRDYEALKARQEAQRRRPDLASYPQVPPPPPLNPSLPGDPAYPGRPRLLDPQTYGPRGEYQRPAPRSSARTGRVPTPEQVEALMEEFREAYRAWWRDGRRVGDWGDLGYLSGMDRALRVLGLDPSQVLTGIKRRT